LESSLKPEFSIEYTVADVEIGGKNAGFSLFYLERSTNGKICNFEEDT